LNRVARDRVNHFLQSQLAHRLTTWTSLRVSSYTGFAVYFGMTLTRSFLQGLDSMYLWYPVRDVDIRGNYFLNSRGISVGINNGISVKIEHNTFDGSPGGINTHSNIENWASYGTSQLYVVNNNFINTSNYAMAFPAGYSPVNMVSFGNYFGTTDPSHISAVTFDKSDDLGVTAFIVHNEVRAGPVPEAPSEVPCFLAGTLIRTDQGWVEVEELRPGARVISMLGGISPVIWVGWRRIDAKTHPDLTSVLPVLVSAGSIAENVPFRDLYLSPDHSLFIDGVLIPIKYLINNESIRQVYVDRIEYYHVELGMHDIVEVNGLSAESFLDLGNRQSFANCYSAISLGGRTMDKTWRDRACAPQAVGGPIVENVRNRINARAKEIRLAQVTGS
jgi:hypothetical protein